MGNMAEILNVWYEKKQAYVTRMIVSLSEYRWLFSDSSEMGHLKHRPHGNKVIRRCVKYILERDE